VLQGDHRLRRLLVLRELQGGGCHDDGARPHSAAGFLASLSVPSVPSDQGRLNRIRTRPSGRSSPCSTQRLYNKECKMPCVSAPKRIRLAAAGWLLLLHQSFEEIMIACSNHGASACGGNTEHLAFNPPTRSELESIGPIPGAASPARLTG